MQPLHKIAKKSASLLPSSIEKLYTIRCFAAAPSNFTLPDLQFDYGDLEPVLPAKIMELHHAKHHAGYVNNLNASLQKRDDCLAKSDIAGVIAADAAIKFNGGGHVNHSIFWTNLAPIANGGGSLNANFNISKAIDAKYGTLEKFQEIFNAQTVAVQGSGWGWLVFDAQQQSLRIETMPNQDPIGSVGGGGGGGLIPLLGIDVWEHAYYLQYENRRAEYLQHIWKVVNWANVEARYNSAR